MNDLISPAPHAVTGATAPFANILCGVDATAASLEAVRQAAALAGPGTVIDLLAVTDEAGRLSKEQAVQALAAAELELEIAETEAHVETRTLRARSSWRAMLETAAGHDLLVVGRHRASRLGAALNGSVAAHAVHDSPGPVLIASPPPQGVRFPGRIVVGADGDGQPAEAIRMAGHIARHAQSEVALLRVDWAMPPKPYVIAKAMAEVQAETGRKPLEIVVGGTPHRQIVAFAEREEAGLIVVGSRELHGLAALRSVSERVALDAPCSVLVVRHHRAGPR